ncbi:hypothetical protein MAH_1048 [Mycobacterium avium subsp. hominissuis TH135]|nr:hypothetical protein MAH_1048 [Mycobacterium avium subsp. hominissuis TH135]
MLLVLKLADPRCGSTRALASRPLCVGKTLSIHDSTFPIERPEMTAVYGFLTTRAARHPPVIWSKRSPEVIARGARILIHAQRNRMLYVWQIADPTRCGETSRHALDSPPGPHSPIGRGSGLKIRPVSVRVRLGAPKLPAGRAGSVTVRGAAPPGGRNEHLIAWRRGEFEVSARAANDERARSRPAE